MMINDFDDERTLEEEEALAEENPDDVGMIFHYFTILTDIE